MRTTISFIDKKYNFLMTLESDVNPIDTYRIGDKIILDIDTKGNNSFDTAQEAIEVATEFKNNPRSRNPLMRDESENYWKSQNYTIVKKTVIIEEICHI